MLGSSRGPGRHTFYVEIMSSNLIPSTHLGTFRPPCKEAISQLIFFIMAFLFISILVALVIITVSYLLVTLVVNAVKSRNDDAFMFGVIFTLCFFVILCILTFDALNSTTQNICTDYVNGKIEQVVTVKYSDHKIIDADTVYQYKSR